MGGARVFVRPPFGRYTTRTESFTASPVGGKLQLQILAYQDGSRVEHLLLSLGMQRQRFHELAHLRMAFRFGGASEFV